MSVLDKIRAVTMPRGSDHNPETPFLQVSDLEVRYNGKPALEHISFELHGGEQIAVVGPNGAGKSTLFKTIAGVLQPASGSVAMRGMRPEGHICIAYLPQRSEVDWSFPATVEDVVMMGRFSMMGMLRHPKQRDWEIVHTCLDLVRLSHLGKHQIDELSGGQQQRMFIAQALAQEAELLMMDEPLNGLDLPSQDEVFRILEELHNRKVTVLLAMHDLGLAASRFERVMLLNKTLLGFGPPGAIFTEERLREAYGGHLQMIPGSEGYLVLNDTCCDD